MLGSWVIRSQINKRRPGVKTGIGRGISMKNIQLEVNSSLQDNGAMQISSFS
jgi:hypothetical protein